MFEKMSPTKLIEHSRVPKQVSLLNLVGVIWWCTIMSNLAFWSSSLNSILMGSSTVVVKFILPLCFVVDESPQRNFLGGIFLKLLSKHGFGFVVCGYWWWFFVFVMEDGEVVKVWKWKFGVVVCVFEEEEGWWLLLFWEERRTMERF